MLTDLSVWLMDKYSSCRQYRFGGGGQSTKLTPGRRNGGNKYPPVFREAVLWKYSNHPTSAVFSGGASVWPRARTSSEVNRGQNCRHSMSWSGPLRFATLRCRMRPSAPCRRPNKGMIPFAASYVMHRREGKNISAKRSRACGVLSHHSSGAIVNDMDVRCGRDMGGRGS